MSLSFLQGWFSRGRCPQALPSGHSETVKKLAALIHRLVQERGSDVCEFLEDPVEDTRLQFLSTCYMVYDEGAPSCRTLARMWAHLSDWDQRDLIVFECILTDDERVVLLATFAGLPPASPVTMGHPRAGPSEAASSPSLTPVLKRPTSQSSSSTRCSSCTRSVHWGPTLVHEIGGRSQRKVSCKRQMSLPENDPYFSCCSQIQMSRFPSTTEHYRRDKVRLSL